jgi:hypothetical protein
LSRCDADRRLLGVFVALAAVQFLIAATLFLGPLVVAALAAALLVLVAALLALLLLALATLLLTAALLAVLVTILILIGHGSFLRWPRYINGGQGGWFRERTEFQR